ncbi:hypothetical protein [Lacticaseibacillus paracasei]|uniref:Uncharacterized protein n=1 Tax=Lacticaseibacillus paracasei subsp. paracasei Lpp126 TaxID=1256206 RepID=S2S7J9_LACPA|nr:hypothetical protein Lpp126_08772 [Lacticaseibacillus paracasei subsp. paracasei Lpp126]
MYQLPEKEWNFLKPRLFEELRSALVVHSADTGKVMIDLSPGTTSDDFIALYGYLIDDAIDSNDEATPESRHIEKIWDIYFAQTNKA